MDSGSEEELREDQPIRTVGINGNLTTRLIPSDSESEGTPTPTDKHAMENETTTPVRKQTRRLSPLEELECPSENDNHLPETAEGMSCLLHIHLDSKK